MWFKKGITDRRNGSVLNFVLQRNTTCKRAWLLHRVCIHVYTFPLLLNKQAHTMISSWIKNICRVCEISISWDMLVSSGLGWPFQWTKGAKVPSRVPFQWMKCDVPCGMRFAWVKHGKVPLLGDPQVGKKWWAAFLGDLWLQLTC